MIIGDKNLQVYKLKDSYVAVPLSGNAHLLHDSISNEELGKYVRTALSKSRNFKNSNSLEIDQFYDDEYPRLNELWLRQLMTTFNAKSVSALFRNSIMMHIQQTEDELEIQPLYIEGGIPESKDVPINHIINISSNASDEELGEKVRLGFSFCKS
jgi:hypothetical protein